MYREVPTRQKGGAGEAEATGRNPTDRAKCGTKRHLRTDGRGIPRATVRSGANRHEMKQLAELLDAVLLAPPAASAVGRQLCLDRGYDYDQCREAATARGDAPHIPARASAAQPWPPPGHPNRHPPRRRVVEVAHRWCNRFRRRLVRWEKKAATSLGFIQRAAILIIYRKLRHTRAPFG